MFARRTVLTITIPLLLAGHAAPHLEVPPPQDGPTLVRRAGLTRIVRVSPDGRAADTIYTSTAVDVHDLTVAPSGRFVAALETADQNTWVNRLVIISAEAGQPRVISRDVRKYVWCCGGQWIAAVTGTYVADAGFFQATGAYLVHAERSTERRLDIPDPIDVTWAAFDSALYFTVPAASGPPSVMRFDPETGESRLTEYRSIRFSPSGAYYLHRFVDFEQGPPGWHIFERETGREVARPDTSLGGIDGWVFGEGDYLKLKRVTFPYRRGMLAGPETVEGYTIYDVAGQAVVGTVQDSIRADVIAPYGVLVLPGNGALRLARRPSELPRD
jgi:hypothetical protein